MNSDSEMDLKIESHTVYVSFSPLEDEEPDLKGNFGSDVDVKYETLAGSESSQAVLSILPSEETSSDNSTIVQDQTDSKTIKIHFEVIPVKKERDASPCKLKSTDSEILSTTLGHDDENITDVCSLESKEFILPLEANLTSEPATETISSIPTVEFQETFPSLIIKPLPLENITYKKGASKTVITIFSCKICGRKFRFQKFLQNHIKTSHKSLSLPLLKIVPLSAQELKKYNRKFEAVENTISKIHRCVECQRKFRSEILLEDHINNVHNVNLKYTCSFCNKKFSTFWFLEQHSKVAHNGTLIKFNCKLCKQNLYSQIALEEHKKIAHNIRKHPYNCNLCEESFEEISKLRLHLIKNHSGTIEAKAAESNNQYSAEDQKNRNKLFCHKCNSHYTKISAFRKHVTSCHKRRFYCFCDKFFEDYYSWRRHEKVHKANIVFPLGRYFCEICTTGYSLESTLVNHYKTYLEHFKFEFFICNVCNQSYRTKAALNRHKIHMHIKPKIYKCDECNKSYVQPYQLKLHDIKCHNKEEDLGTYPCQKCDKKFNCNRGLNIHNSTCHNYRNLYASTRDKGKIIENLKKNADSSQIDLMKCFDPIISRFICPVCGKLSKMKNHFRRHMRTMHLIFSKRYPESSVKVEPKHRCQQCDKVFTREDLLYNHVKFRHSENPKSKSDSLNTSRMGDMECGLCKRQIPILSIILHVNRHKNSVIHFDKSKKENKDLNEFYDEKMKVFRCDICNEISSSHKLFVVHLKIHNSKIVFDKNKDVRDWFQFECSQCQLKHPSKFHLREHMNRHGKKRLRRNVIGDLVEYFYD